MCTDLTFSSTFLTSSAFLSGSMFFTSPALEIAFGISVTLIYFSLLI